MKRLMAVFLAIILFQLGSQSVRAATTPQLYSCTAPIGNVVASYDSGTHGIPGDMSTHTGSDVVYQVNSSQLLQCFCPENSNSGVQSNWWKVPDLTQDEIDFYTKQGWVYVPNGALWGLDAAPYLVKNDFTQCHEGQGGNGGNNGGNNGGENGTGGSNGDSNSNSGSNNSSSNNSSSNSSSSDNGGIGGADFLGDVLGVSSLANTGGAMMILIALLIASGFGFAAYSLRRE